MKRAVLLLSSGLDSAANLVLGALSNPEFEVKTALTIDYGQRSASSERQRSEALAKHFNVEHVVLDLSQFPKMIGNGSALLGGQDVPNLKASLLDDAPATTQSAKAVWVPNRNGVFLSLAAALAESRDYDAVAVGFNAEEAVTFPDNSIDYMKSMSASLRFSTANQVEVVSATAAMDKKQIVRELAKQSFPFEMLWSCYHNQSSHCGACESCQRLKRALELGLDADRAQAILPRVFQ